MKGLDSITLHELYKKRETMFHEIGLLLEDTGTIREIGNKTYIEYEREILKPVIDTFGFQNRSPNEVWKYRGHKLSLIKYYCDTFNQKENNNATE